MEKNQIEYVMVPSKSAGTHYTSKPRRRIKTFAIVPKIVKTINYRDNLSKKES